MLTWFINTKKIARPRRMSMPSMRPAVGDAIGGTVHYAAATEAIGKQCRTGHPQCDIARLNSQPHSGASPLRNTSAHVLHIGQQSKCRPFLGPSHPTTILSHTCQKDS